MKEITYSQSGDYLLPYLALSGAEHAAIGKYGMLRRTYNVDYMQSYYYQENYTPILPKWIYWQGKWFRTL
ncbi:MAG: TnpV protein [Peptococcaceae bacterium]